MDEWVVIVEAMRIPEARAAYTEWLAKYQGPPLADEDVRSDLIREIDGDNLRYLVKRSALEA